MTGRRRILLALACACLGSVNASAAQLCQRDVHQKFDETRIYSNAFIAACKPGAQCRVVTHQLDKAAPLGFSHTFAFQRNTVESGWQVMLVSVLQLADTQAGFDLTIDNNPTLKIVPQHISAPVSINEYALDPALTELVLAEAKPGNNIRWSYTVEAGERQQVQFSLSGLTDAMKWAECAQAELASGKSNPPAPEESKPEYSPPVPGVPVDPVGDGSESSASDQ